EDARQVMGLLLLGAAGDEGRAGVIQTDEEGRDIGRAGARVLLVPDELLHEGRAPAAVLARPRDPGPPRLVHPPLPGASGRGAGGARGGPRGARHVRRDPVARFGAERLLCGSEANFHYAAPAEVSSSRTRTSSSGSTGFTRWASNPASSARRRSSACP